MIRPSLIYAAVTILLAFVDSIRIKRAKGIVENISHKVSDALAVAGSALTVILTYHWTTLVAAIKFVPLISVAFVSIRLAIYDIFLNIFRRMKIDYESPTTTSYVDQHTNKLTFWDKRFIAVGAWFVCWLLYYLIFEKK